MITRLPDCPPADYHLDEASIGYADQRHREERATRIKADAAGVIAASGVPREAAKAIADAAKSYADDLRHDVEAIARREGQEWEVTGKRLRAVGDAAGRVVEATLE